MGFEFRSHEQIMKDGNPVGYRVSPYISVGNGDIVINVQAGRYWGSGGHEIDEDDVPADIMNSINTWSDAVRKSVGLPAKAPAKKA